MREEKYGIFKKILKQEWLLLSFHISVGGISNIQYAQPETKFEAGCDILVPVTLLAILTLYKIVRSMVRSIECDTCTATTFQSPRLDLVYPSGQCR